VADQDGILKGLIEMDALDARARAARETQLSDLKTQLAKLQSNIKAVLDRQATAELPSSNYSGKSATPSAATWTSKARSTGRSRRSHDIPR